MNFAKLAHPGAATSIAYLGGFDVSPLVGGLGGAAADNVSLLLLEAL